jgi:hypothetical protein
VNPTIWRKFREEPAQGFVLDTEVVILAIELFDARSLGRAATTFHDRTFDAPYRGRWLRAIEYEM